MLVRAGMMSMGLGGSLLEESVKLEEESLEGCAMPDAGSETDSRGDRMRQSMHIEGRRS